MRIIYGFIWVIIGFLLIRYSFKITEWFGNLDWASHYFGTTTTMYRLVGLVIMVIALLYMFGLLGFIVNPIAPLFGG